MSAVLPEPVSPTEELRLAVVLNGGVSLAVWMGGVCAEIHELTRGTGVYGRMLELAQATARVDVIAGTSAGGINGAFLALGQAYAGADLGSMLSLWAEKGSFQELMRSPIRGHHDSLLRGDEYFLPELERAFLRVIGKSSRTTDPDDHPVELFLTCTNLAGELHPYADTLGQSLWEVEHTALFQFSRAPREAGLARDGDDLAAPDVARRLALAARSTASFPGAFEPVFVPVRPAGESALPDMHGTASFARSRFVVDGGVLRNQPIAPALKAIWRLPAEEQVRRVMLYVNPDPAPAQAKEPDREDARPPLRDVLLASVTRLTIQQSVHEELREIEASNRRAREMKDARPNLIAALPVRVEDDQLAAAFERYRDRRAAETARRLARIVADEWFRALDGGGRAAAPPARTAAATSPSPAWRAALEEARRGSRRMPLPNPRPDPVQRWKTLEAALEVALGPGRKQEDGSYDLPWIPRELAGPRPGTDWRWGLSPVERLLAFTLDQLKRAQVIANRVPADPRDAEARRAARRKLLAARGAAHDQLRILRAIRRAEDAYWRAWAREVREVLDEVADWGEAPGLGPVLAVAVERLIGETEDMVLAESNAPRWDEAQLARTSIATAALRQLRVAAEVVCDVAVSADDEATQHVRETLRGLAGTSDLVTAFQEGEAIVRRLLLAEVYVSLAGLDRPADEQQEVTLALVSGHARPRWAPAVTAETKIAGLKLGHFGAFYKRSWRVNDWSWGRVDGAIRLCEALLEPARLWQLGCTGDQLLAKLRAVVGAGGDDHARALIAELEADPQLRAELAQYEAQRTATAPSRRTLKRLPCAASWFATARHREVVDRAAIETLAEACLADVNGDTARRAKGAVWALAVREEPRAAPYFWLEQLEQAGVGAETFEGELGTDQLSRTVATLAADVTATLKSTNAGLGKLRVPLQALHGVTVLLYALITSWTGGRTGAALTNLVLALGGALVALGAVAGEAVPGWVSGVGAAVLGAGLAAAALRSRLQALATLLGPAALFVALYVAYEREAGLERIGPVLLVAALVLFAWVMGFAAEPEEPPSLGHLKRVGRALVRAALIAGGAALVYEAGAALDWAVEQGRPWGRRHGWAGGLAACALAGLAYGLGKGWPGSARRAAAAAGRASAEELRAAASRPAPRSMLGLVDDTALAWIPWYGLPFGWAAVAAVLGAVRWVEGKLPGSLRALAMSAVVSWLVLTFLLPLAIVRGRKRAALAARSVAVAAPSAPAPRP